VNFQGGISVSDVASVRPTWRFGYPTWYFLPFGQRGNANDPAAPPKCTGVGPGLAGWTGLGRVWNSNS
jgi:hypothetical protein